MFLPRDVASVSITPIVDTAIYASGDVLFVANRIQDIALNTKGAAYLRNVLAFDADNQKAAIDLLFFDRNPGSVAAINSAIDISAAQMAMLIGYVNLPAASYVTLKAGANAVISTSPGILLPATNPNPSKDIWVVGVSRGTPTYTAATSLVLKFILERQ